MIPNNDFHWGYTTDIDTRYKVRWIETAIVSPCWTSMMVYYVEEDRGHFLNEYSGSRSSRPWFEAAVADSKCHGNILSRI